MPAATGQVLQPHKAGKLVYNGTMPLPASLIASIVSAVLEHASQTPSTAPQYDVYVTNRTLPPEAKLGVMQPPVGNGLVVIDGKSLPLAPAVQFRSQKNLIVMPMSIQDTKDVVYLADVSGAIYRVWMVSPAELSWNAFFPNSPGIEVWFISSRRTPQKIRTSL